MLEITAPVAVDPVIDRDAVRIGEHHAVIGHADHVVQTREALARCAQKCFLLALHFAQFSGAEHARPDH